MRLDFLFSAKSVEEWMTGWIPQDTNGYSFRWDVKPWDQELAFSPSASSVAAASFPPCLLGVTAVRESQSRDSIWEALFLSLNLTLGMQTLWCITSFNRNGKLWSIIFGSAWSFGSYLCSQCFLVISWLSIFFFKIF